MLNANTYKICSCYHLRCELSEKGMFPDPAPSLVDEKPVCRAVTHRLDQDGQINQIVPEKKTSSVLSSAAEGQRDMKVLKITL